MMSGRTFRRGLGALLVVLTAWGALPVTPSTAQDLTVHFRGRVSWIAGDTLVVSTDDTPSGIIPTSKDRVVATSIVPLTP
jgi:hypothetical protein